MSASPAIRVEHLAKRYQVGRGRNAFPTLREQLSSGLRARPATDWFWALKDVSFEVGHGEVLGVIGSNGAGKSTLLKVLWRIVRPTAGRVSVSGRLGCLLEVGTGFHPELTGRENIFLNGAILGMSRRETAAKFDEIVAFSGIEKFIDTPVKRYSSGMYLRLGFAVAAHIDPDILIVDEVLAVGDAAFQAKCMGKMGELVGQGRTVLIVSHQLPVIQRLCSRAILIREGVIAAEGAPREVISAHLSALERWRDVPLAARTERAGRGAAKIHAISVAGRSGAPLVSGDPATFAFEAAGHGRLHCAFTIYDSMGEGVSSFDTENAAPQDLRTAGPHTLFRCEMEALPLRPGRYRLNAALKSEDGVMEDHLESACIFDVAPGLIAGREAVSAPGYGHVELAHRWVVE